MEAQHLFLPHRQTFNEKQKPLSSCWWDFILALIWIESKVGTQARIWTQSTTHKAIGFNNKLHILHNFKTLD